MILVLSIVASMISLPNTNAASSIDYYKASYAYINCTPNPVGVDQNLLVVMLLDSSAPWIQNIAPYSYPQLGGFMLNVTKPDGTTDTLGPFTSDPTGSTYTTYVPKTNGTYYFQFSFPGQTYNTTLNGVNYNYYVGPSISDKISVNVQNQLVQAWQETPLPTEYWTRPINGMNRQWATITGDWIETGYDAAGTLLNPYSTAPESGHVMWTSPIWAGGRRRRKRWK